MATLVKWMGQDRGVRFKRHKTRIDKVDLNRPNPEWNESIKVTEKEGLEWATYIRVEVFDVNRDKDAGGRLGAAFIPIDNLPTDAPLEKEYKITPHRSAENFVRWHELMDTDYGLGTVTVRCQRVLCRSTEPNGSVTVRSQLREVGTLDNFWSAKSVLAGSLLLNESDKLVEECSIYPSLDGLFIDVDSEDRKDVIANPLKYFTVDASTLVEEKEETAEEECSHGLLSHVNVFSSHRRKSTTAEKHAESVPALASNNVFAAGGRRHSLKSPAELQFIKDQEKYGYLIEVFCFENQRKDIIRNEYSAKNLLKTERPWLSDETGMLPFPFESLEAARPPDGYEWVEGFWGRDLDYTACDPEGWSYSVDFLNIMSNLKKGESNAVDSNFFVRRRKWGRFARRCVYPRSGMNDETMRAALSGATTLNSQLDTVLPYSAPVNRQEIFQGVGDGAVLSLCLERGASDENGFCNGPVIIPWNQVMSVHVISGAVLSVVVEIRRFLGTVATGEGNESGNAENFVAAQCEIFIYNCPAEDLALMMNERMSVMSAREQLHELLVSKHINGPEGVQRDLDKALAIQRGDGTGWEEINEAKEELEADMNEIADSIALSKASVLMSQLDEAVVLMEVKMTKLEEKYGSSVSGIEEYDVLKLRISRLKVYLAALLGAGLRGGEACLETFEKDRLVGESLHSRAIQRGADPISAAIDQVNFLLDAMEGRVRNVSLSGYNMKNDELDRLLGLLMNAYYIEIIRVLAVFFDSISKMEAITVKFLT